MVRKKEDIDGILSAAKLDRKDLLPVAQEVAFAPNFSGVEYKLLELPKEIAEKVGEGNRLVFRGDLTEQAVLCTDDATFEVKEAETSNSLLIFHHLAFPEQARRTSSSGSGGSQSSADSSTLTVIPVKGREEEDEVMEESEVLARQIEDIAHSYFEIKRITPNLARIRNALAEHRFKGTSEEEDERPETVMNLDSLLDMIPASEGEIKAYLNTIRVLEIDGSLRLIDDDYLFRVFTHVSQLIDENSWKKDRIPKSVVVNTLISLEPLMVLEKIFKWFFDKSSEESEDLYSMKEDEICRFIGETLLRPTGRFNLNDFMQVWKETVPEGLRVSLKQLEGSAIIHDTQTPPVIRYFPEYTLPENVTDRFATLFEAKQKWRVEEITPYLRNLPSAQSVGILLTKFSRVNTMNGIKYYSSKHGK